MKKLTNRVTVTGHKSKLRNFYHDILNKNINPKAKTPFIPNSVPPFIDQIDLRREIDRIAMQSFGFLRKEYLMGFPYNQRKISWEKGKWERTFYKEYCQGNRGLLNDANIKKQFHHKLSEITYEIVNYYLKSQEATNNG
jgi:hypothetical protein